MLFSHGHDHDNHGDHITKVNMSETRLLKNPFMQVFQTGCSSYALTDPIESIQRGCTVEVRQEEQAMTPDPSGSQEPEKARFHFTKGQGVRIVEGAFTEYI